MAWGSKSGGKQKGYKAPHTLEASVQRQKLIEMYSENAVEIHTALIEKAKSGDVPAIREVLDRAHGKSLQTSEVKTTKMYRLDDPQINKIADEIVGLQKEGKYPVSPRE